MHSMHSMNTLLPKTLATLALCFLLLVPSHAKAQKLALSVQAESAILMNADTGAILYEKQAHAPHYPASITKIATALYALQSVSDKFDVMIAADQDCIGTVTEEAKRRSNYTMPAYLLIPDGSHIGIKKGELLSLRDLFYGMMLASGDDAANVIAKFAGGTIPEFMDGLNAYIKSLGCQESAFYNPHGLHHPKQQTTAYDMAILAREALKNPVFREIVSTVRYTRPKTNKQEPTMLVQTNRLLRTGTYYYSKAIGVKTGYYSLAGSTLVAAAKDGDRTLIAVLLKVNERKDMFIDAKKMFEAAFSQPKVQKVLLKKGPQKFVLDLPGARQHVSTYINEDMTLDYYPAEEPKVKCMLHWDKDIKLPIKKDQRVGELLLQDDHGQALKKAVLFAQASVKATWFSSFKGSSFLKIAGVVVVVVLLGFFVLRRRKS